MELLPGFNLGERVSLTLDGERIVGVLLDVDETEIALRVTHRIVEGYSNRLRKAAEDEVERMTDREVRWELVKSFKFREAMAGLDMGRWALVELMLDETGVERPKQFVALKNPVKRLVNREHILKFESADDLDLDTMLARLED